jgi:hypothetical protein
MIQRETAAITPLTGDSTIILQPEKQKTKHAIGLADELTCVSSFRANSQQMPTTNNTPTDVCATLPPFTRIQTLLLIDLASDHVNTVVGALNELKATSFKSQLEVDDLEKYCGHVLILQTMLKANWRKSIAVQLICCQILGLACLFSTKLKRAVLDLHALQVVLCLMHELRENENIQNCGCRTLLALAYHNDINDIRQNGLQVDVPVARRLLLELGYAKILVATLKANSTDKELSCSCSLFVIHASRYTELLPPCLHAGVVGALVLSLEPWQNEEWVKDELAPALMALIRTLYENGLLTISQIP